MELLEGGEPLLCLGETPPVTQRAWLGCPIAEGGGGEAAGPESLQRPPITPASPSPAPLCGAGREGRARGAGSVRQSRVPSGGQRAALSAPRALRHLRARSGALPAPHPH